VTDAAYEQLSLTELIQLQNHLSELVRRRFERALALAFTDIVGTSTYFARFGDEAGRRLQQLHLDLVAAAVAPAGGRVVDTAGDGAFLCFPTTGGALDALVALQGAVSRANLTRPVDHQLAVRSGAHFGPVLTDGTVVTGDSVNLCARVASTASGGEIRLTRAAFLELPHTARARCRVIGAVELKGIAGPTEILRLEWRDARLFPSLVRVAETGEQLALPDKDTITFGRLAPSPGVPGNDVVLLLADRALAQKISRWHFELRRGPDGVLLRPVSTGSTEIDGKLVPSGEQVPVRHGSVVRLAGVMTLTFLADPQSMARSSSELNAVTMGDGPPAIPPRPDRAG
jgi:class 3 adenylate cyclase